MAERGAIVATPSPSSPMTLAPSAWSIRSMTPSMA